MNRSFLLSAFIFLSLSPLNSEPVLRDLINDYRLSRGLSSLQFEEALVATAEDYVQELQSKGQLSHVDSSGRRVLDRYKLKGGTSVRTGEILGSSTDISSLFTAWLESPTHYKLISDPRWTRIGEALIEREGQITAVVLFSQSAIDFLDYTFYEEGLKLLIHPLESYDLYVRGRDTEERGDLEIFLNREELPLVLIINSEKEGVRQVSDFLYLSDNFFDSNH